LRLALGIQLAFNDCVAVFHQGVMQGQSELVFANAVSKSVKDLAALLIPDVTFSLARASGGSWRLSLQRPRK
jgi:hypothetical protein